MPEDLEERRARCLLWMDRPSPSASFDDGDGDTPDSDVEAENDDAGQYEMDDDAGELFGVNNDADPSMAAM
jgi:hypothetical protein